MVHFITMLLLADFAKRCGGHDVQRLRSAHFPSLSRFRAKRTNVTMEEGEAPAWRDWGNGECMRWTGGTCENFGCRSKRGPTTCEQALCICAPLHCVDAIGECVPERGESLGSYAIRSLMPVEASKPYLGLTPYTGEDWQEVTHVPSSSASSEPVWEVIRTPGGRLRLESAANPGHLLTAVGFQGKHGVVWRAFVGKLKHVYPLQVTFQARRAASLPIGGGDILRGIELWSPQADHALVSSLPGIQEAGPDGEGIEFSCNPDDDWCAGEELFAFEPPLPDGLVTAGPRQDIRPLSPYARWMRFWKMLPKGPLGVFLFYVLLLAWICCAYWLARSCIESCFGPIRPSGRRRQRAPPPQN